MSPQMNGEERDQVPAAGLDARASPPSQETVPPLPRALNIGGVNKVSKQSEELPPLFGPEALTDFRRRWDRVQSGFVDDPKQAVHEADEMVSEMTHGLATRFAEQRSHLESKFQQSDGPSTENLRLALRQYRSFFERLLAL